MRTVRLLAPLALLIPLAAAAPASADDVSVNVVDFQFQPKSLQINPGDTVIWNFSQGDHTSTSRFGQAESWNSRPAGRAANPAGTSFSHTFNTPGRYQYICIPHQLFMEGVVQVGQDAVARTYSRFRQRRRGSSLTLFFRLAEPATVTVKLRGPSHRTVTRRRLEPGSRSIKLSRLREGRYRGRVTFVDDFDKRSVARLSATIR
jgi:plastocyanin